MAFWKAFGNGFLGDTKACMIPREWFEIEAW